LGSFLGLAPAVSSVAEAAPLPPLTLVVVAVAAAVVEGVVGVAAAANTGEAVGTAGAAPAATAVLPPVLSPRLELESVDDDSLSPLEARKLRFCWIETNRVHGW